MKAATLVWGLIWFVVITSAMPALAKQTPPTMRQIAPLQIGFFAPEGFATSVDDRYISLLHTPGEKGADCSIVERRSDRLINLHGAIRMQPLLFSRDSKQLLVWVYSPYQLLRGFRRNPPPESFIGVYNVQRRAFTGFINSAVGEDNEVGAAAFSPDGRTLTIISTQGLLGAFDMRKGHLKYRYRVSKVLNDEHSVRAVLSLDGRSVLRYGYYKRSGILYQRYEALSASTGRIHSEIKTRSQDKYEVGYLKGALSADGRTAAAFFPAWRQWVIFDVLTGRRLWKMTALPVLKEDRPVLSFSPNGNYLIAAGSNGFEIRSSRSGEILQRGTQVTATSDMAWAGDGKRIYTMKEGDGFESDNVLWQCRVMGDLDESREDMLIAQRQRLAKERFALSSRHINESLIQAAKSADLERFKYLLSRGADINGGKDARATPLAVAVENLDEIARGRKFRELMYFLLAHGVDVNAGSAQHSPLAFSIIADLKITKLLFDHGAKVTVDPKSGYTVLFDAVDSRNTEGARLLLDHGAQVDARMGGMTPLMYCIHNLPPSAESGRDELKRSVAMMKLLIERGADVNARDEKGRSILMLAEKPDPILTFGKPFPTVIRLLKSAGAK